jgi:hypothetical protein
MLNTTNLKKAPRAYFAISNPIASKGMEVGAKLIKKAPRGSFCHF